MISKRTWLIFSISMILLLTGSSLITLGIHYHNHMEPITFNEFYPIQYIIAGIYTCVFGMIWGVINYVGDI